MYTVPLYSLYPLNAPTLPFIKIQVFLLQGIMGQGAPGSVTCPISLWVEPTEREKHIVQGTRPTSPQLSEWSWREEKAFSTWSSFHAPKEPLERLKIIIHFTSLTPKLPVFRWVQFKSVDRAIKYYFFM